MTPEDNNTTASLDALIKGASLTYDRNTRHPMDTLQSWKEKFDGKRAIGKQGQDHGTIQIGLDPTNHVEVVLGGQRFPAGRLQHMVDDGSLSVADS
jgi:hypothetical protein